MRWKNERFNHKISDYIGPDIENLYRVWVLKIISMRIREVRNTVSRETLSVAMTVYKKSGSCVHCLCGHSQNNTQGKKSFGDRH